MRPTRVMKMFSGLRSRCRISLVMRGGQRASELRAVFYRPATRESAAAKTVAQRLALKQLRDHVRDAVLRADVVNRHGGFLLESPESILIRGKQSRQNFDRDLQVQARIARAVHLAHSACA